MARLRHIIGDRVFPPLDVANMLAAMAFASLHTMDGDPDDLLARKSSTMDPVVNRLAPQHGALLSATARTDTGLVVFNLWEDAQGAAAFSQLPEVIPAQAESGLPRLVLVHQVPRGHNPQLRGAAAGLMADVVFVPKREQRRGAHLARLPFSMRPSDVDRAAAAALLLACLCSCAYQPPGTSAPAPSHTPAAIAARDILGAAPGGIVEEGAGHLAARGAVEIGVSSVSAGDYSVTAACDGAEQATLTVGQQGTDTPDVTASFPCRAPFVQPVHLAPGSVSARITLPEGSTAPADTTAAVRITRR